MASDFSELEIKMSTYNPLCRQQELKKAISNKNIKEIVSLVQKGYDLNSLTNPRMVLPVVHAANCRDVAICHLLIELGASLNATARPLLNAVYNELEAAVETLIKLGCKVNEAEMDYSEKYNTFLYYLDPNVNYNKSYFQKYKCLHVAVVRENLKILKLLLSADCDTDANITDCCLCTPLHWACAKPIGNPKIVDCLLKYAKNINIGAVDKDGLCAIHLAASNGHAEIVKLLIQAGAIRKLNVADQIRLTIAAVKSGNEETLLDILRAGCAADTNDVSIPERPLSLAIATDNETFVEILHEFGADFNVCDITGKFPVHLASGANPRILEYLLKNGADVNAQTVFEGTYGRETGLIHAIGNEFTTGKMRLELIKMYIHGGAKLNSVDCHGMSALFKAVLACFDTRISKSHTWAKSRVDIVCLLLMEGATVPSLQFWRTFEKASRGGTYLGVSRSDIHLVNLLIAAGGEIPTRILTTIEKRFGSSIQLEFIDCFKSSIASPRSLLSVCRLAIRKELLVASQDRAIGDRIRSLCLPEELKHYLLFKEEISKINRSEKNLAESVKISKSRQELLILCNLM